MAIIAAASTSRADVQTACDAANDGDTVTIPAGDSDWDSPYYVASTKKVHLQGAGVGSTIFRSSNSDATAYGMITYKTIATEWDSGPIITGISLYGKGDEALSQHGIKFEEAFRNFRIFDCHFEGFGGAGINISPTGTARYRYGVIYNCTFTDCYKSGYGYGVYAS